MNLQNLLRKTGLDEDSVREQGLANGRAEAKTRAEAIAAKVNAMGDQAQHAWYRRQWVHPRHRRVSEAEADPDLILVSHLVLSIEPHERGIFAYLSIETGAVYCLYYSAPG